MYATKIEIRVAGRKILLKMPKNETDIHFVKGITYSRWNQSQFVWEVPHYPGNLEKLISYFGDRLYLVEKEEAIQTHSSLKPSIQKNELVAIQAQNKRIKLIFGFNPELIKHIKTIPYASWDRKNKWWTIPYSEQFLEEIKMVAKRIGLQFTYEIEPPKKERCFQITAPGCGLL